MSDKPIVGYWNIRGIGAHIRLLLTHLGVDLQFRAYECGDAPDFDRSQWLNEKFTLGLRFPNLPYYIDGDVKLTETLAILQYICQKYRPEYLGRTPEETRMLWMLGSIFQDIVRNSYVASYNREYENARPGCEQTLQNIFTNIANAMGENTFAAGGDEPTWIDFSLFEVGILIERQHQGLIDSTSPKWEGWRQRVSQLPGVQQHLENVRGVYFNNKSATFNIAIN